MDVQAAGVAGSTPFMSWANVDAEQAAASKASDSDGRSRGAAEKDSGFMNLLES